MEYTIFDKETNGLYKQVTKIHCISYADYKDGNLIGKGSITTYEGMKEFYATRKVLVGHNITIYDLPVAKKILGVDYQGTVVDTLGISWYMFPIKGFKHGLEAWGERLGFPKPPIEDWTNLPLSRYVERCEGDVEINTRLFHEQLKYLKELYAHGGDISSLFSYLHFKMECLRDQEQQGIPLDIELCKRTKLALEREIEEKESRLREEMPKVLTKTAPKVMYKKDGMLSVYGERWMDQLEELGLPEDTREIYEHGNPGSHQQVKDWLFSLGWEPMTFKPSSSTGEEIPQISLPFGQGICPSIEDMYDDHPVLENLGGLYMLKHRLGLVKGFLETVDEKGKVYSRAHGFTNTLRLKHSKPIANLPGVDKPWGKEIRGAFMVPDKDHVMCGSDISGLEDNTKQHYIYFYDPKYVEEMRVPGFDPHMDIGKLAGIVTEDDEKFFQEVNDNIDKDRDYLKTLDPELVKRFKDIKKKRGTSKTVNFSATYGAGAAKIAKTAKCDLSFAQKLHSIYWKRNAAVKKTANSCTVVSIRGQKWLYNPISGFWMFLKADKDRFSTLNQSSGVFVFDSWVREARKKLLSYGIHVLMQYHDELMIIFPKGYEDIVEAILRKAMQEVNEKVKLNVEISISVDFGNNYADCH